MLRLQTFLVLLATLGGRSLTVSAQTISPLHRVEFSLDEVADSERYLVYAYRIVNGRESQGGAAVLSLDVSAPRGTGFPTLPATGRFDHGAGYPGVVLARFRDHVPVGPISPTNWEAFLTRDATLDWYGSHGGFEGDVDSISPGDSLRGFGLRSPYLPGIRQSWAAPTFKSCCTGLRPRAQSSEPENPNPNEFRVSGWTVGPTYRPGEMTLRVMASQLGRACGELSWINPARIYQSLRTKLDGAARGEVAAAKQDLKAFLEELEAEHSSSQQHVSDNAYWLLKVNAEYLLAHM